MVQVIQCNEPENNRPVAKQTRLIQWGRGMKGPARILASEAPELHYVRVSHLLGDLLDMVHILQVGVHEGRALLGNALGPCPLLTQLGAPALPCTDHCLCILGVVSAVQPPCLEDIKHDRACKRTCKLK